MPRPIVLVLLKHYLPGSKAGGPIRSLSNMVGTLHDSFDFRIFTSDRDYGDAEPYAGVHRNAWNDCIYHKRFYADGDHRGLRALGTAIRQIDPDVVYLNSLFDWQFSIAPLLLRRSMAFSSRIAWVLAPRGECSRGAMALKQPKKRGFLVAARAAGLHRGLTWQASSPLEAADIRRELGVHVSDIVVAPNLTEVVKDYLPRVCDDAEGRLNVCFLSRITPKKNLAFAIEALAKVRTPVAFHIYGPVEDEEYAATCRSIAERSPPHLSVTWHGHLAHDDVRDTLQKHDLFLFPTLGENFGHVIFESLAAGVPVLVSDQTPWRDLEQRGVGWVRSLDDPLEFANVIEAFSRYSKTERLRISKQAYEYARSISESSASVEANKALFYNAMEKASGGDSA